MVSPECDVALKEWAILCHALAQGRQILLLRKGGILDRTRGGFGPAYRSFFLFPTYHHERPEDLVPEARSDLAGLAAAAPPPAEVHLSLFATVEEARFVPDLDPVLGLAGEHLYSESCVRARYAYRKPGMWVLLLRAFHLPRAHVVENLADYAGCVSWVPLRTALSTAGARPVLTDEEQARRRDAALRALA
jgi:hypothetical protein